VRKDQDPRTLGVRLRYLDPDFYVMVLEKQIVDGRSKLVRIVERM